MSKVNVTQSPHHHHKKEADKTNIFVVLNKTENYSKLQKILYYHTKFKKIK